MTKAEDVTEATSIKTEAGRLYASMQKMESSTSFDFHNNPLNASGNLQTDTISELLQLAEEIFLEDGALCKELGINEFPPKLETYWGEKKRQNYLVMDNDIK